jgi:predicted transcriptional regulator
MVYIDSHEQTILEACRATPGINEYSLAKAAGLNNVSIAIYVREMHSEGLIRRQGTGYAIAEELVEDKEPAHENCCKRSGA